MRKIMNSNKAALSTAALMLGGLLVFTACGSKTDKTTADKPVQIRAAITFVKGSAFIERNGERQPAQLNAVLQQADTLITEKSASVEMVMQGYGAIKIGPQSKLEMLSLAKSGSQASAELKLQHGKVASFINRQDRNSKYKIVTPTAIAGVRGTAFFTEVEKVPANKKRSPKVKVAVLSGSVAVALPGQKEVILEKNSQMVIDGFRRISRDMVRPLSPESLKIIKNLAVFHKSNVLEFDTMLKEARGASTELRRIEEGGDVKKEITARAAKKSRASLGRDVVARASRTTESKALKRDISKEHIKLKPTSGYKE